MHRNIAFAFVGVLATCVVVPALAAPSAPVTARAIAQCEALEKTRPTGGRTHQQFLADCLAGRGVAEKTSMTYDECEALSIQRGNPPEGPGFRQHEAFMRQCLAGKVPR